MQTMLPLLLLSMPHAADVSGQGETSSGVSFGDEFDAASAFEDTSAAGDVTLAFPDTVKASDVAAAGIRIPDFWLVRPLPGSTPSQPPIGAADPSPSGTFVRPLEGAASSPPLEPSGAVPPTESKDQGPNGDIKKALDAADRNVRDLPVSPPTPRLSGDQVAPARHPVADIAVAGMTPVPAEPMTVCQSGAGLPDAVQGLVPVRASVPVPVPLPVPVPVSFPVPDPASAIPEAVMAPVADKGRPAFVPPRPEKDVDRAPTVPLAAVAPQQMQAREPDAEETGKVATMGPIPEEGTAPRLDTSQTPKGEGRLGPPVMPGEARFAYAVTVAMQPADVRFVPFHPSTDKFPDTTSGVTGLLGSLPWPSLLPSAPAIHTAVPASPVAALAAQIVQSAGLGETTTEVALSPDELGEVRLSFRPHETDASRIVVMMTFERPEAMDLFRRNADQLVADLKMAGFTGADLGFAQSNSGGGASAGSDQRPSNSMPLATEAPPAAALAALRPGATASLDLRL